jgi:hypothetical protein
LKRERNKPSNLKLSITERTAGVWAGQQEFGQDSRSLGRTAGVWARQQEFGQGQQEFGQDSRSLGKTAGVWARTAGV